MTPQSAPHSALKQHRPLDPPSTRIASAERELGAFQAAVRQKFGEGAAQRAGTYWIEALEAGSQPFPGWRAITIAASSRLAKSLTATGA